MSETTFTGLQALAESVARSHVPGLVDLYLERVSEVSWRLEDGQVRGHRALLREGAAVRRAGSLVSSDGLERAVLADLLLVPARSIAPFSLSPLAAPPAASSVVETFPAFTGVVRWRASLGTVVRTGRAVELRRPPLVEVELPDGQRRLGCWPPPPSFASPEPASEEHGSPRPGRATVLLAPAASAVFIHELFGHPLEADLLLRGASPWSGRLGATVVALELDVDDDPTHAGAPGSFSADDEGSPAARRVLLRGGRIEGALVDREHAPALSLPAGNARRSSVHAYPRPRVSNLVVRARDDGLASLRAAAKLEVTSLFAGTIEPRSGLVMLSVRRAFSVRRGERQRALDGFTLVGTVASVCDGLRGAAGAAELSAEPGWCGKNGETVPTGAVTPWLLVAGWEVR